jgi:hypothetical protein
MAQDTYKHSLHLNLLVPILVTIVLKVSTIHALGIGVTGGFELAKGQLYPGLRGYALTSPDICEPGV